MSSKMSKKEFMIAQRTYEANKQKQETKNVRNVCMVTYLYIYIYIYMRMYIYIHIHTCICLINRKKK
jgi:hypothetical protein